MLQETPPRSVFAGVPGERGLAHAARPFLFVSDLHLSDAIPHTVAAFEHFVRVTADSADSVFILGDLFEYWIGDDILDHDPFAARMAALLHTRVGLVAAQQHEPAAQPGERRIERAQRSVQPPARRAAQRSPAGALVEHIDADHRAPGLGGARERGMIGYAQIIAKPNDGGCGRVE